MNTFSVGGESGLIKWGYREVATLTAWSIADGGVLRATVVQQNESLVTQAPLTFVVPRPTGKWTWDIDTLQITGNALSATLRP